MSPKMKLLAVGGGALALVLLAATAGASESPTPGPGPSPGPGPGPNVDPRPNPFPVGAGEARVIPNNLGGMVVRKGPGTNFERVGGTLVNGSRVAVLQTAVGPQDGQGGEWWKILTPAGIVGYSRAVDGAGVRNYTIISNIQAGFDPAKFPVIAGAPAFAAADIGSRFQAVGTGDIARQRRQNGIRRVHRSLLQSRPARISGNGTGDVDPPVMACAAPAGTFLRSAPNAESGLIVPQGARLLVEDVLDGDKRSANSPNAGGWAKVRYFGPRMNAPVSGYVLSEWLVDPGQG